MEGPVVTSIARPTGFRFEREEMSRFLLNCVVQSKRQLSVVVVAGEIKERNLESKHRSRFDRIMTELGLQFGNRFRQTFVYTNMGRRRKGLIE